MTHYKCLDRDYLIFNQVLSSMISCSLFKPYIVQIIDERHFARWLIASNMPLEPRQYCDFNCKLICIIFFVLFQARHSLIKPYRGDIGHLFALFICYNCLQQLDCFNLRIIRFLASCVWLYFGVISNKSI